MENTPNSKLAADDVIQAELNRKARQKDRMTMLLPYAGIAGLFTVARAGVVDTSVGSSTNLNVMVGIVLGGFPLSGGANSRFSAPIIGTLMVTVLTNGLGMLGYASAIGYGIKGLLFIAVIALTYEKSKGKLVE